MITPLLVAAIRLYCEPVDRMEERLAAGQGASKAEAEQALAQVRALVACCIEEIHQCYQRPGNSERPVLEALQTKFPDLSPELAAIVFRYSSWCVAKGA